MTAPAPFQPPFAADGQPLNSLVVRRDRRRHLTSTLALTGAAVLLVCWLPAVIVLARAEAAYFTNGIVLSALIGTAAVLLIGLLLALWIARGERIVLRADGEGIELPGTRRRAGHSCAWDDVILVRLVGKRDPALAFYLREPEADSAEQPDDGPDLTEPELLRPLDFHRDPPPAMRLPEPQVFAQIRPAAEPATPTAQPEPVSSAADALHATPHVVPLSHTDPPLAQVLRELTRLAAGRVRFQ